MLLATITQKDLDALLVAQERFARGARGGNRLNLQFQDASGLVFSNRDLRECAMVGGNFKAAVFKFARLSGANFYGANLEGADLASTALTRADLRGALMRGANLECADLSGADLRAPPRLRPDEAIGRAAGREGGC